MNEMRVSASREGEFDVMKAFRVELQTLASFLEVQIRS